LQGYLNLKRCTPYWVVPKPNGMLQINISNAEIQKLNYERFRSSGLLFSEPQSFSLKK
jgi:hypothetical protein